MPFRLPMPSRGHRSTVARNPLRGFRLEALERRAVLDGSVASVVGGAASAIFARPPDATNMAPYAWVTVDSSYYSPRDGIAFSVTFDLHLQGVGSDVPTGTISYLGHTYTLKGGAVLGVTASSADIDFAVTYSGDSVNPGATWLFSALSTTPAGRGTLAPSTPLVSPIDSSLAPLKATPVVISKASTEITRPTLLAPPKESVPVAVTDPNT